MESVPILPVQRRYSSKLGYCFKSKEALLILLWNFSLLLIFYSLHDVDVFLSIVGSSKILVLVNVSFSSVVILSPMVGILTDVKLSRYRAVLCSSYSVLAGILAFSFIIGLFGVIMQAVPSVHDSGTNRFILGGLGAIFLIPVIVALITAFQFGMDQLHDAPTEDSIFFISWYVWMTYAAVVLTRVAWWLIIDVSFYLFYKETRLIGESVMGAIYFIAFSLLTFSLFQIHKKKLLFHIDRAKINPYKLVYRVTRFACRNKVPLRRSAFTYCEDELPSRMDLGKQKYGGPFTTKEVEDVKAFWGILKILVCIGPTFLLQTSVQATLPAFSQHSNLYRDIGNNITRLQNYENFGGVQAVFGHIFIYYGLLSPLLVVFTIPLYLCFIRQWLHYHISRMFKRIGLGIVVMIMSLVLSLAMDVVVHQRDKERAKCMFSGYTHLKYPEGYSIHNISGHDDDSTPPLYQNIYFFTLQHLLSAAANMLIDIAVFEFICSQSPYSMKGLLLGLFYSIRSLFQALVIALIFPFGLAGNISPFSCGSSFYLMNIVIGVLELAMFCVVAKRYKYRTVDEPSNEYRYAEEYYSNLQ